MKLVCYMISGLPEMNSQNEKTFVLFPAKNLKPGHVLIQYMMFSQHVNS